MRERVLLRVVREQAEQIPVVDDARRSQADMLQRGDRGCADLCRAYLVGRVEAHGRQADAELLGRSPPCEAHVVLRARSRVEDRACGADR